MLCFFFVLCRSLISGGRSANKRRQHGHRIHNKAGGAVNSLGDQGKHGGQSELQAIDPNAPTPPPHRRGPRRHSNGKSFVWKQVGFSECSKTCGGGEQQQPFVNQSIKWLNVICFWIISNQMKRNTKSADCLRPRQRPSARSRSPMQRR